MRDRYDIPTSFKLYPCASQNTQLLNVTINPYTGNVLVDLPHSEQSLLALRSVFSSIYELVQDGILETRYPSNVVPLYDDSPDFKPAA